MRTYCPGACDYPKPPPAPQDKKQSFSRVADIASICPRERAHFTPLAAVFKQSSVTIRQHTSIYNLRLHVLSMPMNNHLSSPIITILNNDLLSAYILFLCSGVVKVAITVVLNIIDILFLTVYIGSNPVIHRMI